MRYTFSTALSICVACDSTPNYTPLIIVVVILLFVMASTVAAYQFGVTPARIYTYFPLNYSKYSKSPMFKIVYVQYQSKS